MRFDALPEKIKARTKVTDSCWIWTGAKNGRGYGVLKFCGERKWRMAHRVTFELLKSKIPAGLVIDHLCRNTSCVNPEHLEAVSQKVNVLRGTSPVAKGARKMKCKHGHKYTPENTRMFRRRDGREYRRCVLCRRAGL